MTLVRPMREDEVFAVDTLLKLAFPGPEEADLVRALRAAGEVTLELVAEGPGGGVAGHVLLSPLRIEGSTLRAAALAPLAVMPARQGEGIGGALCRAALEAAKWQGVESVLVLGDPGYYTRFGFSVDAAAPFVTPFPPGHFMAAELRPGALAGQGGRVIYPAAFGV